MPYVTRYKTVSKTVEQHLGYDEISTIRPNLCFFEFTGLRPSTPHWLFFDGVEVTKWANTTYTLDSYNNADRSSDLRNPGDKYLTSTSFPAQLGGPTSLSSSLFTDSTGTMSGMFYIQSNSTTSFPTGTRALSAIDLSVLNPDNCLSFAQAEFSAIAEYELYYEYNEDVQEPYEAWIDAVGTPTTTPVSNNNSDDNNHQTPVFSYSIGNTWYNSYDAADVTNEDEYQAAAFGNNVVDNRNNDNDNGSDNSKILCYLAYRNGLLDEDIYRLDEQYGDYVSNNDPDVMNGYHAWAMGMVRWVDEGSWLAKQYLRFWVAPLTRSWGRHIAHMMQPENYKYNLWGHTVFAVGTSCSRLIGKLLRLRNNNKVKV